jgi:hypothetical protein
MSENHNHPSATPDGFGKAPNVSEPFGTVPHAAEPFRRLPNDAESFRSLPRLSERNENHTLTVREAVKLFEAAGVARTERSITNWCQPNRTGIARLDSYFDPNERKYFITPQSVELAIEEEKAKAAKINQPSEAFGTVPHLAEASRNVQKGSEKAEPDFPNHSESREIRELENEIRDLQITNKAKDIVIEKMEKERVGFFEQVISANRKMGELEARLLQLRDSNQP